jgi:short subunit dehydrogenase-like uncharacterized protein
VNSDAREHDLVIFGASGFTGGLVARHVAAHARADLRIALAGRRLEALHTLRDRLQAAHPERAAIGVVGADVSDQASLSRMAGSARAVVSTVGPFIDHGEGVVRACVAQGTHYLDSTGEHSWVREMTARYDAAARERAVKLIFACAFESVPADLGVFYTVQQLPADKPLEITGYVSFRGHFSGATVRSSIKEVAAERPPAEAYAYERAGRSGRYLPGRMHRAPAVAAWVSPYDSIEPHIVLQSAAALERYGPRFTYTHMLVYPSGPAMLGLRAGIATFEALVHVAPLRALMLRLAQSSGRGPTEAQMARGWFRFQFDAQCEGQRLRTEVSGGDPGYGTTSMMLGQCALCLLEDREALPVCSGVVTTAQALGERLLPRLQAHGMQFRVLAR